jgi:high-affinity K+ transport system ATPase subunit B
MSKTDTSQVENSQGNAEQGGFHEEIVIRLYLPLRIFNLAKSLAERRNQNVFAFLRQTLVESISRISETQTGGD